MQKKLQENDRCPKEIKMKFEFPDMPYINDSKVLLRYINEG